MVLESLYLETLVSTTYTLVSTAQVGFGSNLSDGNLLLLYDYIVCVCILKLQYTQIHAHKKSGFPITVPEAKRKKELPCFHKMASMNIERLNVTRSHSICSGSAKNGMNIRLLGIKAQLKNHTS